MEKNRNDVQVGKRLHGLAIGDDWKTLFISRRTDDRLVALDTETGEQRALAFSPEPHHLDRIPGTGKVYVSSSKTRKPSAYPTRFGYRREKGTRSP